MRNRKNENKNSGNSTRFLVKTPVEGAGDKVFWRTIGSAWLNPESGDRPESISIRLDALPLSPSLQCYPAESDGDQAES